MASLFSCQNIRNDFLIFTGAYDQGAVLLSFFPNFYGKDPETKISKFVTLSDSPIFVLKKVFFL